MCIYWLWCYNYVWYFCVYNVLSTKTWSFGAHKAWLQLLQGSQFLSMGCCNCPWVNILFIITGLSKLKVCYKDSDVSPSCQNFWTCKTSFLLLFFILLIIKLNFSIFSVYIFYFVVNILLLLFNCCFFIFNFFRFYILYLFFTFLSIFFMDIDKIL